MGLICAYEKCNNEFEIKSKFHPHQKYCCHSHGSKQWIIDNPTKRKTIKKKYDQSKHGITRNFSSKMKRVYNITGKEYDILLESQNMVCAICEKEESHKTNGKRIDMLSVDHDHKTGEVRGLLCHRCNVGLGSFDDDIEKLEKAINYLKGERS